MRCWQGRTSWWSRAAAACAAAWCAIALGAQFALLALGADVGARGGMAPMRTVQRGALPDAHCTAMVAGMHAAGAHHSGADGLAQHGSPSNDHRCCTCFGPCCHAAPAVVASPPVAIVASVAVLAPCRVPPVVPHPYRPTAPEHARPPSIGPPVGLTA